MKIHLIINQMGAGGAERVVGLLGNYLSEKGHDVTIITFQGEDAYALNAGVKRLRLHKHPLFRSVVFNGFWSLGFHYLKKKNRPDIINSHIDTLGFLTIPIAKLFGLKIIVSEHNNHLANNSIAQKFLWNFMYPLCNAVTILTQFDLDYFKKRSKKAVVMPNPCTFNAISREDAAEGREKEILLIGGLNRFHQKGFDNFIPIAKSILERYPDWQIRMAGSGEYGLEVLKKEVEKQGITDRFEFLGLRDDVSELLRKASIFVLPSRYEGLPMVLLEAMSQGAACIAYDCISGPSDIISHQENGILIENQNHEAMINGIGQLIEDTTLRQKLHRNAPAAVASFSLPTVGQKWERLLEELLPEAQKYENKPAAS